ncbi:MAG: redoxin domain-containing protein [Desulfuromonadales bacterium]|nr:redoxin domain-containing protein [Desulfuromonadales bacterium]
MQAFQRDLPRFAKLNAQVLGISGDSLDTHREFSELNRITYPLISDQKGEIRRLFGSGRITYIVDREGFIRFIQKGVPDNEVLLKELAKLPR